MGVLGVYLDITARKVAEEEIRALSRFPDENPNPVMRVEENGMVKYANNASRPLMALWGCNRGELLTPEWLERITQAIKQRRTMTLDVACNAHSFSVMIVPIADGGYVNIYGRDITDSKRTEE